MADPIVDGGGPAGLPAPAESENTLTKIVLLAKNQLQDLLPSGAINPIDKWRITTKLLPYLNLGIIEIINLKPEAYPTPKNLVLVAGAKQDLPAGDVALIDVVCNMGAGATVGRTITSISKENMDRFYPGWMAATAADEVLFAITDTRTPRRFYVYPPQPIVPKQIQAIVSTLPAQLTQLSDTFPLDDSYKPAMVDYLIHRALAEETTIPNALAKSKDFYNRFLQDLGLPANVQEKNEQKGK